MKLFILTAFAMAAFNFCGKAQYTGITAERFRVMANADHPEWNSKINYSTINKSNMKSTIFMATVISAALTVNAQTVSNDEQAIRNIVTTMQKGWNTKDGKMFASGFAPVHNYVVVNGMYLSSITQEGTARGHQNIFNTVYKTTSLELKIDKVSFINPELAMTYVLGATYDQAASIPENPGVIISMLFEKKNDEWKIISFHNCPIQVSFNPGDEARLPVPPKIMYAAWYKK